jgi:hypothetical protein
MPIRFRLFKSQHLILAEGTDPLTDADCSAHARRVLSHSDFKSGFFELLDLREASVSALTGNGVFMTAREVAPHIKRLTRSKLAIVVADEAMFGMARMYQLFIGEFFKGVQVFRNIDEALDFVGLEPPELSRLKNLLLTQKT